MVLELDTRVHLVEIRAEISVVLTKVVLVNSLYSTHILDPWAVAKNIVDHHAEVDRDLAAGNLGVVKIIQTLPPSEAKKNRVNYSFATKYCAFQNPLAFPLYDDDVATLLWKVNIGHEWGYPTTQDAFKTKIKAYQEFKNLIDLCLKKLKPQPDTRGPYKALDKDLWICAKYFNACKILKEWEDYCPQNFTKNPDWTACDEELRIKHQSLKRSGIEAERTVLKNERGKIKKYKLTSPQKKLLTLLKNAELIKNPKTAVVIITGPPSRKKGQSP